MGDKSEPKRLPRNFHRTFKPECRFLNALLRFAAGGGQGDCQAIAEATGIPTGVSTGKVPAILDYCRGMGLIQLPADERSAIKKPSLTAFGRIVLLEDPYLKREITQWIAHFNLCDPFTGADVWYHTFVAGTQSLGMRFARTKLDAHLGLVYGVEKGGLIGPMVGMYEDEAAFKVCGALNELDGVITRKPAPIRDEMAPGYGAWLIELIRTRFPHQQQVSVTELETVTGWRTIPGWDAAGVQRVLEFMVRKGLLDIDRHMEPWLLTPCVEPAQAWKQIYDDLL